MQILQRICSPMIRLKLLFLLLCSPQTKLNTEQKMGQNRQNLNLPHSQNAPHQVFPAARSLPHSSTPETFNQGTWVIFVQAVPLIYLPSLSPTLSLSLPFRSSRTSGQPPTTNLCCLIILRYSLAAARPRRKLCSSESHIGLGSEGKDRGWIASPHRSPMLGRSKHSSEVDIPSHPRFSLTHTIPLRLTESQGYSDITVMTDEEGVEERYQPTKCNLVRNFPQPLPTSTAPNNLPSSRDAKLELSAARCSQGIAASSIVRIFRSNI